MRVTDKLLDRFLDGDISEDDRKEVLAWFEKTDAKLPTEPNPEHAPNQPPSKKKAKQKQVR